VPRARRGADIQNILSFEKDYPRARIVRLEQNYRSTETILRAAGAVVANNEMRKGKTLWTRNPQGERIVYMESEDADAEAHFVSERIVGHLRASPGAQIAILYRANHLSRALEEKLRRYNLNYRIAGGFSFYERAEIKDLLSYLTAVMNPHDSVHIVRIVNSPPRGIGKTTLDALTDLAAERETSLWTAIEMAIGEERFPLRTVRALEAFRAMIAGFIADAAELSAAELLERIARASKYLDMLEEEGTDEALSRIENIRELLTAAAESGERGETVREFLDHAALVSDQDAFDEKAPITLMTLHTAKGLEFPIVFIVGLEDDILPHERSKENQAQFEEERRLFYVGITRAEKRLYLTRAQFRRFFGGGSFDMRSSEASPFLSEIPPELIEDVSPIKRFRRPPQFSGPTFNTPAAVGGALSRHQAAASPPATAAKGGKSAKWSMGTRVKHAKYGYGTILRVEGEGEEMKLTVSFVNFGLKKMIARYAELTTA
jgi:DNA helicase-2/ATP-dependent DNA helicase PcrA